MSFQSFSFFDKNIDWFFLYNIACCKFVIRHNIFQYSLRLPWQSFPFPFRGKNVSWVAVAHKDQSKEKKSSEAGRKWRIICWTLFAERHSSPMSQISLVQTLKTIPEVTFFYTKRKIYILILRFTFQLVSHLRRDINYNH